MINRIARFTGYNPPLPAGTPANLVEGDLVFVYAPGLKADQTPLAGSFMVRKVTHPDVTETAFETRELVPVTAEEEAAALVTFNAALNPAVAAPAVAVAAPVVAQATDGSNPAPAVEGSAPAGPVVVAPPTRKPRTPRAAAPAVVVQNEDGSVTVPAPTPARRGRKPASAPTVVVAAAPAAAAFKDTAYIEQVIGGDALRAARTLIQARVANDYALGGVLSYVKRNAVHLTINNEDGTRKYANTMDGFGDYLKTELGIEEGYRAVKYKIECYEDIAAMGLDPALEAKVIALGYTKVKDLIRVMKPENAAEMVEKASTMNSRELTNHVRTTLVAAGDPGVRPMAEKTVVHVVLHNDIGKTVRAALEDAKAKVGPQGDRPATDADALGYIATVYQESLNPRPIPLEAAIESLELKYGVTVTAVPDNAGTVAQADAVVAAEPVAAVAEVAAVAAPAEAVPA